MAAQQLAGAALTLATDAVVAGLAGLAAAGTALTGPPPFSDAALLAHVSQAAYTDVQQLLSSPKVDDVKCASSDKVWKAALKVESTLPPHQGRWFCWNAAPLAGALLGSPWVGQDVTQAVVAHLRTAADVGAVVRMPASGTNGRVVFMLSDTAWEALLRALPRPAAPALPPPRAPHVAYVAVSGPSRLQAELEYLNFLRLGRGVLEATAALRPLVAAVLERDYVATTWPAVAAALPPWCCSVPTCPYHGTAGLSTKSLETCDYCKPWVDVLVTRHVEPQPKVALRNLHFGNCVPSLLCDAPRGWWEAGKVYVRLRCIMC